VAGRLVRSRSQLVESKPTEGSVVKKGRHRRFEEARSLKRSVATAQRRCPECGAEPEDEHASWCLAETDELEQILGTGPDRSSLDEDDPLAD
jgi:hypothetical protein